MWGERREETERTGNIAGTEGTERAKGTQRSKGTGRAKSREVLVGACPSGWLFNPAAQPAPRVTLHAPQQSLSDRPPAQCQEISSTHAIFTHQLIVANNNKASFQVLLQSRSLNNGKKQDATMPKCESEHTRTHTDLSPPPLPSSPSSQSRLEAIN